MSEKFHILKNDQSEKRFYNVVECSDDDFTNLLVNEFEDSLVKEGDTVDGTISDVGSGFVLVDVGLKSKGKIPVQQFADPSILVPGNIIPVHIENAETRDGNVGLSYSKALKQKAWQDLYALYNESEDYEVEGKILYTIKNGCVVDVNGLNAFLPSSHVDIKPSQDAQALVGIKLKLRILKMDEKTGKIFVSRRKVLNAIYEDAKNEYIKNLSVGQIVECKVKSITSYGAFLRIHDSEETGEIYGLLYIDDISWARVSHPSSIYTTDQTVTAKIIAVDLEKKKISLGVKQMMENPWKNVSTRYVVGKIYTGTISAVEDYGLFVKLEDGVEGLVPNSEISWVKERNLFLPNQKVEVLLLSSDEEKHKIALSIRQCAENPWQKFLECNCLGTLVSCIVSEINDSGMVVSVKSGDFSCIKGFIRLHNITWESNPRKELKKISVGDELSVKLIHANVKRCKMIFSLKHVKFDPFEGFISALREGDPLRAKVLRIEDDGIYVSAGEKLEFFTQQSNVSELTVGQELSFTVENKEKYKLKLIPQDM